MNIKERPCGKNDEQYCLLYLERFLGWLSGKFHRYPSASDISLCVFNAWLGLRLRMRAAGSVDLQQFQMYFDKFFPHKVVTEFPHVPQYLANACNRVWSWSCQKCNSRRDLFIKEELSRHKIWIGL